MNANTATDVVPGTDATSAAYNNLRATILLGWYEVSDTWTYSSFTSATDLGVVTVPTDATTVYQVGMKVRYKQGGSYKYGYIVADTATTITITGGDDYQLANAVLTNIAVSAIDNPQGFPAFFNYSGIVTYTGFSVNPPTPIARFLMTGRICRVFSDTTSSGLGTSNSGSFTVSLPITTNASQPNSWGQGQGKDNTTNLVLCAVNCAGGNVSSLSLYTSFANAGWSGSGGKGASFQFDYLV